jgi:hypothetical protein
VYVRLVLLAGCVILMGSALLFALVWGLLLLFGKMKEVNHLRVRVVPVLAILCLLAAVFSFGKAVEDVGVLSFWSAVVFLATLLFALLSLIGLFFAVRVPKTEIHNGVRIHSLLVSLACCIVTIFFSAWHLIGLRLWAS